MEIFLTCYGKLHGEKLVVVAKTIKGSTLIGSELMFRRILCAAQINEIELPQILSHELTLVPMALFHEDGSMRKTTKSDLAKKIEDICKNETDCPLVYSIVIDGMVMVQEMNEQQFVTFNDLGRVFLQTVLNLGRKCQASRFSIVFDTYKPHSVKAAERFRRGESNSAVEFNVSCTRKIPKFRDFLKSGKNKQSLTQFLVDYMTEVSRECLKIGELLIIAGGSENPEQTVSVGKDGLVENLNELYSNQEEADTRIILHVLYESRISQHILIKSVDRDVLILLIHFLSSDSNLKTINLFMQLGHGKNRRFVSINTIQQNLGERVCSCLLTIHCLTGCDTTSAFYKVGKKTALEILKKNIDCLIQLSKLPLLTEQEALRIATKYVLLLYRNRDTNIKTLNDLRLKMATTTNKPSSELLPTDEAFYQHFLRCMYQLKIWYSSSIPKLQPEDISCCGWILTNDCWSPIFSRQKPIPDIVRQSLSLFCSDKACSNKKCTCIKEGIKCCEQCKCVSCKNSCTDPEDSEQDEGNF